MVKDNSFVFGLIGAVITAIMIMIGSYCIFKAIDKNYSCYVCGQHFHKEDLERIAINDGLLLGDYEWMCHSCATKFKKHTYLGEE